jgi:adenylate cyclase
MPRTTAHPSMPSTTTQDPWTLPELTRARRAIVVVDVVESVRLMQEDEAGFIERWRRFVHQVRNEVLPKHGGRMVKSLGDGMLLEFEKVPAAVASSFELLALSRPTPSLQLRVGAHCAEVSIDDLDVFGAGVNLAARIATLAMPNEIVASADFRDEISPGLDAEVEDLGECRVKHVAQPIRAFRLGAASRSSVSLASAHAGRVDWSPALAVIPPRAYLADRHGDVLGDIVADSVIAALCKARHLRVISRLSTQAFKHRASDLRDMGTHLGAAYVLGGSYQSDGSRFELRAELADTRESRVLWADVLRCSLGELFAVDGELAQRLAVETGRAILSQEVARSSLKPMPTQEAYTLLMAAVHLMHRNSRSDFDRARELLEHLIDRHPLEALPRAWLGKWYGVRAAQGWTSNLLDDTRQALAQVQRALDTDPTNALAWAIKGLIHGYINKDMNQAHDAYESSLAANPNESLAWLYSATLAAWRDEGQRAVEAAKLAQRLSPLDPLKYYYDSLSATAFLVAGEHDLAIDLAHQSLRLNRSHISTHRTLTIAHVLADRLDDARNSAKELLQLDPLFTVGAFRQRYPGRDSAHAQSFCDALAAAGVPD